MASSKSTAPDHMSTSEWYAKWVQVGRYQEWLPDRAASSDIDALNGITSSPGFRQDRQMLDELLRITRAGDNDVALHVLQADDDVWVYVRGDEVVVAKEHEYRPVDEHRYLLLPRAEFLRFLEYLGQVANLPADPDAEPMPPIFVESVPIGPNDVIRFKDETRTQ